MRGGLTLPVDPARTVWIWGRRTASESGPIGSSLRTELRETVEAATEVLGFRPILDTTGPLSSATPDDIVSELLARLLGPDRVKQARSWPGGYRFPVDRDFRP
jgi:hypothetical protein